MTQLTIAARIRDKTGKENAKKLRHNDEIPAVFYGSKTESVLLAVNASDMKGILKKTAGENVILSLEIASAGGKNTKTVMIKELQTDPIKDLLLHADFYEIAMDQVLTVNVPVHLINMPVGVSNDGGILQHIRRELTISGLPNQLVEHIDVDVANLEIGDSIHISDIEPPEGVTFMEEGHLTVAVVAAPTVVAEVEEEEEIEEEMAEEEEAESQEEESA
jgi:large subunit ribosomal protein L25